MKKSGSPEPKGSRYEKLVAELSELFQAALKTGSEARNEDKLESYWQVGKKMNRFRSVSPVFINVLAKDLGVNKHTIYRCCRFHSTWSDGLSRAAKRLTWGHHLPLFGIKSAKERDFYVASALAKKWSRATLARARSEDFYRTLKDAPEGAGLARGESPLHVYKAKVFAVVDGDTLAVKIDLGFETWSEKRLRLRGINAGELAKTNAPSRDAKRAERAKAFVAARVLELPFVVIKTYKTDIYGRYVADVFYHASFADKHEVAQKGVFLNEELVREGLAERVDV